MLIGYGVMVSGIIILVGKGVEEGVVMFMMLFGVEL